MPFKVSYGHIESYCIHIVSEQYEILLLSEEDPPKLVHYRNNYPLKRVVFYIYHLALYPVGFVSQAG